MVLGRKKLKRVVVKRDDIPITISRLAKEFGLHQNYVRTWAAAEDGTRILIMPEKYYRQYLVLINKESERYKNLEVIREEE